MKSATITDLEEIRRRAREHVEHGAVTDTYRADRAVVLKLLNEALATELVCALRYKRHYFMAVGIHSKGVAEEFKEHAEEETEHADWFAGRIVQLDGEPNFNPEGLLSRSHSDYAEGGSLLEMITEDLVAERIAIGSYTEIIRYLGDDDPLFAGSAVQALGAAQGAAARPALQSALDREARVTVRAALNRALAAR